jgi:hypothetical protein
LLLGVIESAPFQQRRTGENPVNSGIKTAALTPQPGNSHE